MRRILKQQPVPRVGRNGDIHGCIVQFDDEWEEFIVIPTINGGPLPAPTHYHADDREDAYMTAARMIADASNR